MDYPDRIKTLIYEQLLHFSHLHEQRMELELKEIKKMVQLQQLKDVPGNLSTIHVLDCIGDHEPINHSAIAEKLKLSKASITKISKKLLELELIHRTQLNDNRKEVYFRLTPKGNSCLKCIGLCTKRKSSDLCVFWTITPTMSCIRF